MHAHRQRLFAWIAMLAILGAALLPSVTHGAKSAPDWMLHDLCLSAGVPLNPAELAAAFGDEGGKPQAPKHVLDHCPFCCGHPLIAVLPAQTPSIPLVIDGGPAFPHLFLASPRRLFAWSPSLPRGPPANA